ncbi:MAG: FKBP-type peptidyl-prolyl cis-trans isomerase [Pseudomonadota bacterium]
MRYVLVAFGAIVFLFGVCFAAEKGELTDQKDKESYSLGYQFGQSLKKQKVDISLEVYLSGIRDALEEKEPRMKPEEILSTISNLRQRLIAAQNKLKNEQAAKNLEESKTFLAENAKKEGVIALPSGLQYKILDKGEGRQPEASDTVTVQYRGSIINGAEFDSSYQRGKPETFQLNRVIAGWKEALSLMKEGAKWQLFIPPELAYGKQGQGSRIPPNAALIFEVELLKIASKKE